MEATITPRETDSEGSPCTVLNHYHCHCPDCRHTWQDAWTCEVNDTCPECGQRDVMPHYSPAIED